MKKKAILFDLDNTLFPFFNTKGYAKFNVKNFAKIAKLTVQKIKKSKCKVGIVSNCNLHEALEKINILGINKFIDVIITPENIYDKKPMRKMFFGAIKELNVKPSQILFVGDHLIYDVWSAKSCGVKTVLIKEKLKLYHKLIFKFKSILRPDFVVNDLRDVLKILKSSQ